MTKLHLRIQYWLFCGLQESRVKHMLISENGQSISISKHTYKLPIF